MRSHIWWTLQSPLGSEAINSMIARRACSALLMQVFTLRNSLGAHRMHLALFAQTRKARRVVMEAVQPASPSGARKCGPQRTLSLLAYHSSLPFDLLRCSKNLFIGAARVSNGRGTAPCRTGPDPWCKHPAPFPSAGRKLFTSTGIVLV